uniref:Uncharacterized protein n=1 Tax=Arundo donax TaxID=35708 RepID=A0A0A8ZXK5_ARUDO
MHFSVQKPTESSRSPSRRTKKHITK